MLTNKTDGNVSGGAYKLINITNLKEIKISKQSHIRVWLFF